MKKDKYKTKGGRVNMCKVLQELLADALEETVETIHKIMMENQL